MQKRTLYILAVGIFGIGTTEFGVIGILPQLASAFHVSIQQAGWLLSGFALAVAVSGPFMMLFLSAFNRKNLLAFVLGVFTLSNLLSIVSPNFGFLLAARILPGFFHPVYWSIALSTAANIVAEKEAPKAVGVVFGGFTIASIIGVPMATLMADVFNWKASFMLYGFINLVSLAGLLLFLPDIPIPVKKDTVSHAGILKKKILWLNLLLACFIIAAMYATYGYMADYLGKVNRMNGKQISILLFVFGIAGVLGNYLAGKFLSKNRTVTTLLFIPALAAAHILLYFLGAQLLPIALMVAVWGLIHTGGFLISNITVTSSAPEAPEFINSIFTSCGNIAVTMGTCVGGYWIVKFGIHQIVWSSVLLLVLALVMILVKEIQAKV
ncbi:MFS transporter [Mucilaginibacter sp. HC2]|uniref:MFS transporter n=1 Tax=Mucilaginibacter inviolabilis TaxID=2714892 RepID=UPI00140BE83A|nr:MFS transporter [Mucilaginibacter inviolabilis]NHA04738.1 MFS transporter [Mucilaginibacter inviolabilis]